MKFLKIILMLAMVCTVAYSAAPAATAVDAAYGWEYDMSNTASSAVGADTLVGTDSTTLWTNLNPAKEYEYFYVRDAITGTGSDSVNLQVRVDCKATKGGTVLYRSVVDTITAAAGEAIGLALGTTNIGQYFDVKLIGLAGTGGQVIINRGYLARRRPVTTSKPWR